MTDDNVTKAGVVSAFDQMASELRTTLAELEDRATSRSRDLATAAEVSRQVAGTLDLDKLLPDLVELTKERFGLYHSQVYMVDEEAGMLTMRAGAGDAGRIMKEQGHGIPLNAERSLVAGAARTQEPVVINDVTKNPDHLPNPILPATRSELAIPLVLEGKTIGVLDAQADKVNRFTEDEVLVFQTMAEQVAVAVQNAQLFAEQTAASEFQATLFQTLPIGLLITDMDRQVVEANPTAESLLGYKRDEMIGRPPLELIAEGNRDEFFAAVGKALNDGETVDIEVNRLAKDGQTLGSLAHIAPRRDTEGETAGVLVALEDTSQRERSQQRERLAYEVGEEMSQKLEVDGLLSLTVQRLGETFKYYHAHIYLLDDEQENLIVREGLGTAGTQLKDLGHSIPLTAERGLVVRAAQTKEPVVVNDVTKNPDHLPNPLLPETISEVALPLMAGGDLLGILDVQHNVAGYFDSSEVGTLRVVASQLGTAISNARLLENVFEALAESERNRALLRNVLDASRDWIWVKNTDHEFVMVNRSMAQQAFDMEPDEIVGKTDYDFSPKELVDGDPERGIRGFRADDVAVLKGEALRIVQDVVEFTDGTEHILDTTKVPMYDNSGNIIGTLGVGRDTTAEVRAQQRERLANSLGQELTTLFDIDELQERTIEQIVSSLGYYHTHIYQFDTENETLKVSKGYGTAGQQLAAMGHAIPLGAERSLVARSARTKEPVVVNDVTKNPDHLPNPLLPQTRSEVAVPLIVGGSLIGVLDVQHNEPDFFSEDEVQTIGIVANQLSIAMSNANLYQEQLQNVERLREVDRLKSEFLANMSHELRTPLNSIIGYSELLIDDLEPELDDMSMEDLKAIHSSGQHLLAIINDVLDLAKIEAARLELQLTSLDLSEIIEQVTDSARVLLKEKPEVDLHVNIPNKMPLVTADAVRTRQVLWNLLSNAVKFTDLGHVRLTTETKNNMLHVAVEDTGAGIAPEYHDLIFDQFRQADGSATRRAGGAGLGLAITRQLVALHGGDLWLDSVPGKGSTFTFSLPLAEVKESAEESVPATPEPAATGD